MEKLMRICDFIFFQCMRIMKVPISAFSILAIYTIFLSSSCYGMEVNVGDYTTNRDIIFDISIIGNNHLVDKNIVLKCTLTNVSSTELVIWPIHLVNLQIYIKSDGDYHQMQYRLFVDEVIDRESFRKIKTGESVIFKKILNNHYTGFPMSAGEYSVFAIYTNNNKKFEEIEVWTGKSISNIIQFTVADKERENGASSSKMTK